MIDTSDLFALLDARRVELGLSQAEVGRRAFGQADGSALQNIKRGSSPTFDKLQRLCEILGMEVRLGEHGALHPTRKSEAALDDFCQVPLHEVSLSAGGGFANSGEHLVEYLAFRKDWLRKIGLAPASAVLARADGESMQPTIWSGDLVLIDQGKASLRVRKMDAKSLRGSIYAFVEDGHARLKRISRPSETELLLLSDNPDYGPQMVGVEEIKIIGKVVWWGHTDRE